MLKTKETNIDLYLKGELSYDFLNDIEQDEVEMIQLEQRRNKIQYMLDEGYVYSEEEAEKYKEELKKIDYTLEHLYDEAD